MKDLETNNLRSEWPADGAYHASGAVDVSLSDGCQPDTGEAPFGLVPDWLVRARLGETPPILDRSEKELVHFVRSALGGDNCSLPAGKRSRRDKLRP